MNRIIFFKVIMRTRFYKKRKLKKKNDMDMVQSLRDRPVDKIVGVPMFIDTTMKTLRLIR